MEERDKRLLESIRKRYTERDTEFCLNCGRDTEFKILEDGWRQCKCGGRWLVWDKQGNLKIKPI